MSDGNALRMKKFYQDKVGYSSRLRDTPAWDLQTPKSDAQVLPHGALVVTKPAKTGGATQAFGNCHRLKKVGLRAGARAASGPLRQGQDLVAFTAGNMGVF